MDLAEMTGESAPSTHGSGLSTNGISAGSASCDSVLLARVGRDAPSINSSLDILSFSRWARALSSHAALYAPPELPCARFVDPLPQCVTSADLTSRSKGAKSEPRSGESAVRFRPLR